MGNLVIGNDKIAIKNAIMTINKNIFWLQHSIQNADLYDPVSLNICRYYTKKLEAQKITLDWLTNADQEYMNTGEKHCALSSV